MHWPTEKKSVLQISIAYLLTLLNISKTKNNHQDTKVNTIASMTS